MNLPSVTNIRAIRKEPEQFNNRGHGCISQGKITSETDNGGFIINGSIDAQASFSCIVKPETGDVVVFYEDNDKTEMVFITDILKREHPGKAEIRVDGADELTVTSRNLNLVASENLGIKSMKSIDITAYLGSLTLTGKNLVSTVKESIIQTSKNHINHVTNYTLNVKQLLRTHGKHHIMTADEEIRMDGERINMG